MQKIKKAEIAEKNCAAIAATNAENISKQMTLGKSTANKLQDNECNNKILKVVRNLAKTRIAELLLMSVIPISVQAPED